MRRVLVFLGDKVFNIIPVGLSTQALDVMFKRLECFFFFFFVFFFFFFFVFFFFLFFFLFVCVFVLFLFCFVLFLLFFFPGMVDDDSYLFSA